MLSPLFDFLNIPAPGALIAFVAFAFIIFGFKNGLNYLLAVGFGRTVPNFFRIWYIGKNSDVQKRNRLKIELRKAADFRAF
ncbi:MAG: hypothetical protein JKX73_09410 [Flavobacteriales bacterium]|nr:hypothetical protein [Flavobacteriales bacterium]